MSDSTHHMTAESNGRHFWLKFAAFAAPFLVAALIGWGSLRSQVSDIRRDVDTKASREVVDAYFQEVLRRLDRIERKLQ